MTAFATTRWSLIVESRSNTASAREALQSLCTAYRGPVLAYVRHRGYALCAGKSPKLRNATCRGTVARRPRQRMAGPRLRVRG